MSEIASIKAPPGKSGALRLIRERIVARARGYFFAHGFRAVTMDDLAEELGMSKKTLYAHFRSKTALLEAVIDDKFNGMSTVLARIMRENRSDFPSLLRELLACQQQETGEVQPPFIRDVRREAPELFKLIEARRREVIQKYFGTLFARGQRAGRVRKDIPARLMTEILLGATDAIMNPLKITELGLTPKTGFSAIVSVILSGVITEKGKTKI